MSSFSAAPEIQINKGAWHTIVSTKKYRRFLYIDGKPVFEQVATYKSISANEEICEVKTYDLNTNTLLDCMVGTGCNKVPEHKVVKWLDMLEGVDWEYEELT